MEKKYVERGRELTELKGFISFWVFWFQEKAKAACAESARERERGFEITKRSPKEK